jgi:hypothetical protein
LRGHARSCVAAYSVLDMVKLQDMRSQAAQMVCVVCN